MGLRRFVQHPCPVPMSAGAARGVGWRIWRGQAIAPTGLKQRAALLAEAVPETPGRVHGLGRFEDGSALQALKACLPGPLAAALRPTFEWYGCRGAGFHTDSHFESVLFGAWGLAGPERHILFAGGGGLYLRCATAGLVVFDPFLPHAVLDPDQSRYERSRYTGASASVFLGFELELTAPARAAFGIGPAEPGAFTIGSATAVNAETGAFVR